VSCFLLAPDAAFKRADPAVTLTMLELDEGFETDGVARAVDGPAELRELGLDVVEVLDFDPGPPCGMFNCFFI